MHNSFKCYQQGFIDACTTLHDKIPGSMLMDDPVDEGDPSFDRFEYLRGQVGALIDHIKREDVANNHAFNVASCLANGIQPD